MAKSAVAATDFTVGWVCALPIKMAAAAEMMDEEYADLAQPPTDTNIYTYGRVGVHKVVVACLPAGQMGTNSAAAVVSQMWNSFPALRFGLLVGIGGGVPSEENDIRLGDVVISQPFGQYGGVVQYDFGKTGPRGRVTRNGSLNAPPPMLLSALAKLRANDMRSKTAIPDHLSKFSGNPKFTCPGPQRDTLYSATSQHVAGRTCLKCSSDDIIQRDARKGQSPALFFGNIASGNQVMRDGAERDRISQELGGVLCFEMEAVGLMNNIHCLVVRGICDYADAHKNKQWQPFAAAAAAAAAKELLHIVPPTILQSILELQESQIISNESHFLVSIGRNEDFVGRESVLEQLLELVNPSANEEDCQRIVIEGLGGIGKTQIALEVAYRTSQADPNCSVFWVPAINMAAFDNACRDIGHALKVPGIDNQNSDFKALVKEALNRNPSSWLLIIDDVDMLLRNDGPLQKYLPFNRKGSILFTTRSHEAAIELDVSSSKVFAISELSKHEAVEILEKSLSEGQMEDNTSTTNLLEFLAYLPLAIKQAAVYMKKTDVSTHDYLKCCLSSDKSQIELLSKDFGDKGRYRESFNPIATTRLISFHNMGQNYPLAAQYLKFICFLAEKDIPISLLLQSEDKIQMQEAISILKGYAFIIPQKDAVSFDMHRLVRIATRNWVKEERETCITGLIQHICQAIPFPTESSMNVWRRFMPHALAVLEVYNDSLDRKSQEHFLYLVAETYRFLGNYAMSESLLRHTLDLSFQLYGREDPHTLDVESSLGLILNKNGKLDEAEQILRDICQRSKAIFGQSHPVTLRSQGNLGTVLVAVGQYNEAEKIFRNRLDIANQLSGQPDPMMWIDFLNLSRVLIYQEKGKEAEQISRRAQRLAERAFGLNDPRTLKTTDNLAIAIASQGRYQEAEKLHRYTLELCNGILGQEHPDTITGIQNIATTISRQGGYQEAERLHQHTLELRHRILGQEHPLTIESIQNLAGAISNQGRCQEAEQLHRYTLELRKRILGQEHPDTIASIQNLASITLSQGRYQEAEQLSRHVLELCNRILGQEHPDTIRSIHNLGDAIHHQRRIQEAEKLFRYAVELQKKVLGQEHPETISSVLNIVNSLERQGRYSEGIRILRHNMPFFEKLFGLYHCNTLNNIEASIRLRELSGRAKNSPKLMHQTLKLRHRLIGLYHPGTIGCMFNLGWTLERQEKMAQAKRVHQCALKLRESVLIPGHPDIVASQVAIDRIKSIILKQRKERHQTERMIRKRWMRKRRLEQLRHMYLILQGQKPIRN